MNLMKDSFQKQSKLALEGEIAYDKKMNLIDQLLQDMNQSKFVYYYFSLSFFPPFLKKEIKKFQIFQKLMDYPNRYN